MKCTSRTSISTRISEVYQNSRLRKSLFNHLGISGLSVLFANSEFRSCLPLDFVFGAIGRLLPEALSRPVFPPSLIEASFIFVFPWMFWGCIRTKASRYITPRSDHCLVKASTIFWWSLARGVLILRTVHASFGILNPDSAIRCKTNFESISLWVPTFLSFMGLRQRFE